VFGGEHGALLNRNLTKFPNSLGVCLSQILIFFSPGAEGIFAYQPFYPPFIADHLMDPGNIQAVVLTLWTRAMTKIMVVFKYNRL
jgi:hypothetical protein